MSYNRVPTDNKGDVINLAQHPIISSAPPLTYDGPASPPRVYKRRFLGLTVLVLQNILVSWGWLTFAASSKTSAQYFDVTETAINWLSTAFLFAFVAASIFAILALNRGPKLAMMIAGGLLVAGCWLRYAGSRIHTSTSAAFGLVVFGQMLIGFAQPFVLIAPTRYSHLWFGEKGRITATAVASLANPFGGALGQLIGPFVATTPEQIPSLVLYVAIIVSPISLATVFLPKAPPTPPTSTADDSDKPLNIHMIKSTWRNLTFQLILWPFVIYVAAFNATATLLNQILEPYGFSEEDAGLVGAVLIVAGLVASAVASPLIDRHPRARLPVIKMCVGIIGAMYLTFIWIPESPSIAGPYIISAILGMTSFIILPLALEMMVSACHPVGPEVSSTLSWALSQLAGGILVIAMNALKGTRKSAPEGSMYWSLVLQAVLALIVLPPPLFLGYYGTWSSEDLHA